MSILTFHRRQPVPQRPTLAEAAPTVIGESGWHMVQLDPRVNPVTGQRDVVGHTGPMSRDSAHELATEMANRADGWMYGMRRPDGLVMVVDPGDHSYEDFYSGEQVAA